MTNIETYRLDYLFPDHRGYNIGKCGNEYFMWNGRRRLHSYTSKTGNQQFRLYYVRRPRMYDAADLYLAAKHTKRIRNTIDQIDD